MSEINISNLPTDLSGILRDVKKCATARNRDLKQIEKSAKDFEAVLLNKVMEEMDKSIPRSGLLESGISDQVRGMFWFYLAQDMADKGELGLWKDIQRQMKQYAGVGETASRPEVEHTS